MGNWGIEMEMEKINGTFWFHKNIYIHVFLIIVMSNFLHRLYMEFTYEIIGNQIEDLFNYNWDGDFCYRFNTSLTFALNFTFVKTPRFTIALKLISITYLSFCMLTFIFVLSTTF
jgi:hypothetical protein